MALPNAYTGDTPLVWPGASYTLRYDWRALGALQTAFDGRMEERIGEILARPLGRARQASSRADGRGGRRAIPAAQCRAPRGGAGPQPGIQRDRRPAGRGRPGGPSEGRRLDPVATAYRAHIRHGLAPGEFWSCTPYATGLHAQAMGEERLDRFRLAMSTAWHTEAFARTDRLPALAKVLDLDKPAAPVRKTAAMIDAILDSAVPPEVRRARHRNPA